MRPVFDSRMMHSSFSSFLFFFSLRSSFPAMSIRSFYYLFLLSRISSPLSAVHPPPIIASPQTAALQLSGLPIATHRCSSPTPRLIFSRSLDLPICLLCVFLDGCLVQRLSTVDQVTVASGTATLHLTLFSLFSHLPANGVPSASDIGGRRYPSRTSLAGFRWQLHIGPLRLT